MGNNNHRFFTAAAAACIAIISACAVCPAATQKGMRFTQGIGASINPLGVMLDTRLHYTVPLISRPGILWESTKIDFGLQNDWTPTDNFFGAFAVIEPIAIFDVFVRFGAYGLYDAFGYGHTPVKSIHQPYDNDALDTLSSGNAGGWWLRVAPTLKLKFRSLIFANTFTLNHIRLTTEGLYLEMRSYVIHRRQDTDIADDTYLFWEFSEKIIAGVSHRYLYVTGTSLDSRRVSLICAYSPTPGKAGAFSVIAIAGYYISDPLFKGAPFGQALVTFEKRFDRKKK